MSINDRFIGFKATLIEKINKQVNKIIIKKRINKIEEHSCKLEGRKIAPYR
jgi:hypothetical protein